MVTYVFIFLALLAIGAALGMVISKNTVNSALFLVLNMGALSGIYLILEAQFLAIIQILVYAGAIMVLFLFVIMLLNLDAERSLFNKFRIKYFIAFLLAITVLSQILYSLGDISNMLPEISPDMAEVGTVEAVGSVLFTDYLLPFEMTAILLTAAVVGALLIAQHNVKSVTDND